VEVDDPVTGGRYIVEVCESGTEFFDPSGQQQAGGEPPLPLLSELNPILVGDHRKLKHDLLDTRPEEFASFSGFVSGVFAAVRTPDKLTCVRATKWAFDGGSYRGTAGVSRALDAVARVQAGAEARRLVITARARLAVAQQAA